eukprot:CAMPEP_0197243740 /NCGR_PEP_ID=MMETSP1429-20130617/9093_1 /TAXON_ID=49237 /ORGANISM="Chaetoceros  sp., Strain UNC1202" /LENGTH=485 /DNA_ID=CAMNT_0042704005 /DNA_START=108 /DNA_END=1565 /DNA_ORIENTATION=+
MSKPHERLDEDSVVSEFVTNENAQNFTISEDDIAGASDDVDFVSVNSNQDNQAYPGGLVPATGNTLLDLESGMEPEPPVVQDIRDDEVSDDESSAGSGGYIDEEVTNAVLSTSEDRFQKARDVVMKKYCMYSSLVFCLFVAFFALSDSDPWVRREIENHGSNFHYDDAGDYPESAPERTEERTVFDNPIPFTVAYPRASFGNVVDVRGPVVMKGQTPFFWNQPDVCPLIEKVLTSCYGLVLAADKPGPGGDTLQVYTMEGTNRKYLNVDLSDPIKIQAAAGKQLVQSQLANAVASDELHFTASLIFNPGFPARLFTVMRHPVDRAISSYYTFLLTAESEMTLEEYIASDLYRGNYVTDTIANPERRMTSRSYLDLAKELIRTKFVVGLHDEIRESISLFEDYFYWHGSAPEVMACKAEQIKDEVERDLSVYRMIGHRIKKGSDIYKMITSKNIFDMELYWYAVDIHKDQRAWIPPQKLQKVAQVN